MEKRFLPIGTVVLLKGSDARTMIAGYAQIARSEPGRIWDYSGFKFPIGYVRDDEIYCFDADQIESIIQYGFRDYEWDQFMDRLDETLEKFRNPDEPEEAEETVEEDE